MKIVIDGNIGAGKTTQLSLLQKLGGIVFREPIEEWPLREFYEDPVKGIFPLQMAVLRTIVPQGPGFYERSLLSSRWVFWEWAKRRGIIEHEKTYEYFYEHHKWSPDLYIFLSKSPEDCYLGISSRKQVGDDKVTLQYLQELDLLYKELLEKIECKVYVIDASKSPGAIHTEILHILNNNECPEMLFSDNTWKKVQELGHSRGEVCCPSRSDMCRLS